MGYLTSQWLTRNGEVLVVPKGRRLIKENAVVGNFTILRRGRVYGRAGWLCRCICGRREVKVANALKTHKLLCCSKCMPAPGDIAHGGTEETRKLARLKEFPPGRLIGNLKIVKPCDAKAKFFLCKCRCGSKYKLDAGRRPLPMYCSKACPSREYKFKKYDVLGVEMDIREIHEVFGISLPTFRGRLRKGKSIDEALFRRPRIQDVREKNAKLKKFGQCWCHLCNKPVLLEDYGSPPGAGCKKCRRDKKAMAKKGPAHS